jgi:adenylate cyclase
MTATSRLATILNADVVGYSHLTRADEQSTLILAAMQRLADGSGYSGLITAGKEGMLERLKVHHREVIDRKIGEHHGQILKAFSDGMLVGFPGPVEAVCCAVEMQQTILERNAETVADERISFRMAVSLGSIAEDKAIKISARLRALAEPGGVCISRAVRELIRNKLFYPFEDIGEYSVEHLAVPVRAYAMSADAVTSAPSVIAKPSPALGHRRISPRSAVVAAGVAVTVGIWTAARWSWLGENSATGPIQIRVAANPQAPQAIAPASDKTTQAAPASAPAQPPPVSVPASLPLSIIVLPFANLSNDPGQQYFTDAITDDLTSDLSRIAESFVIARNTAFAYKGKSVAAKQIGRELGVRYVLEGGVRRAEDQVQIDTQLVEVEDEKQLWAQRFETDRARLADARNEITLHLARTFGLELREPLLPPVDRESAVDPDARDLIMRGWAWYYRPYSTVVWQEARRDFEQALEVDPHSIDARIGIATTLSGKFAEGWTASLQQDTARAEQLLGEALERDASRPAAHFAMGVLRQMQNRLPEAQAEYEAAIALDHNHARAYLHLGQVLMFLGQPEAGAPPIEKAIRLNPYDPNIASAYWALGTCYLLRGQLDEAIEALKKAQVANARLWFPHLYLAGAFGLEGDLNEARLALAESTKLNPAVKSLARMRGQNPWLTNPRYWDLQERTLNVGLRRAGLPEE